MNDAARRVVSQGLLVVWLVLGGTQIDGAESKDETSFRSRFEQSPDRVWVGPEYFANRLQDWRIRGGRLECVEGGERFPMRTLNVLTRSLRTPDNLAETLEPVQLFELVVDAGRLSGAPSSDSWIGFLIGAGGESVDHRITALVHHRPAEDGGLLAVVDGQGRLAFRDNSRSSGKGNLWSLGGKTDPAYFPILAEAAARETHKAAAQRGLRVTLVGTLEGGRLILTLVLSVGEEELGRLRHSSVPKRMVEGGISLVSHRGPHWFQELRVSGAAVQSHPERKFGPVLGVLHTRSAGGLKLTAQMGPLGPDDSTEALLQVRPGNRGRWQTIDSSTLVADSYTFPFRDDTWDARTTSDGRPFREQEIRYRVLYDLRARRSAGGEFEAVKREAYEGVIPSDPVDDSELVIATLTCQKSYTGQLRWNEHGIWFPHAELARHVSAHDPDLLFFSGDQIYEGDLTPPQTHPEEAAILDYHYKWYRWHWSFGDLTRRLPCVCIPDDHDVYHGNLWGAGGRRARARDGGTAQDGGGYKMSPRFVNMVHRTQTSHLPDPVDPGSMGLGYSVYFTRVEYGGVSFAVLSDRQWKSAPAILLPEGRVKNGWFRNPDFDPTSDANVPGAVLLGDRQLRFLREWAVDWRFGAEWKVALSQSIFTNLQTLPAPARSDAVVPSLAILAADDYSEGEVVVSDADSNGWPQSGRDRAVRELRRALALHLAGDQHLGATIQYGVEGWRNASYAFSAPSIANTWPRRWYPPQPGENRGEGWPRFTGDYRDGFGNAMTVYAVANPRLTGRSPSRLYDLAPGYGIVRFHRSDRSMTLECWPRWVDPTSAGARPFAGWPIVIDPLDNQNSSDGGYWLPELRIVGFDRPILRVMAAENDEVIYTLRLPHHVSGQIDFQPRVSSPGRYRVAIGNPDEGIFRIVGPFTASAGDPGPDQRVEY